MLFHLLHFAFNKSSKGATSKQSLSLMYVHWFVSATKLQREGRVDVSIDPCVVHLLGRTTPNTEYQLPLPF